jgi:hypothetical protein
VPGPVTAGRLACCEPKSTCHFSACNMSHKR